MQMDLQSHTLKWPVHDAGVRAGAMLPKLSVATVRPRGAMLVLVFSAMLGCRATAPPGDLSDLEILSRDEIREDLPEVSPATDPANLATEQPTSEWQTELASDVWVRTVAPQEEQGARRWRHEGLEQLFARVDSPEEILTAALHDADAVVRTNAAIGLSRLDQAQTLEPLSAAVASRDLAPRLRQAAAEAFGETDDPRAADLVVELIDVLGRFDDQHLAAYHPDLHAELLRSLKDWHQEQVVEVFREAISAPSPEVRLVAIQAWSMHPEIQMPDRIEVLREDRSPQVRAAAMLALANHRTDHVEQHLESGLRDQDRRVALAAIAGLGKVATETSTDRLRRVVREEPEVYRAAAVEALAQLGDFEVLSLAADDASWRVRLQAARELRHFANQRGVELAKQLLDDSSIEVRRAVVGAVADWPLSMAGEILLDAMSSRTYRTRSDAAKQLTRRWPPSGDFIADESETRRAQALSRLHAQWHAELATAADPPVSGHSHQAQPTRNTEEPDSIIPSNALQRVQVILQQLNELQIAPVVQDRLLAELKAWGPALPEILERSVVTRGSVVSEEIYLQVLPSISPLFQAIEGVALESAVGRRAAANQLIEFRDELAASELAASRLFKQIIVRNDPLVWRSVQLALESSSTDAATQIACAAAGHPSAEIRRRACEHLARHPDPRHQALLTAALNDPDTTVVRAAVVALGAGGQMDDPRPLRWLLRDDDWQLQLVAAIALVELNDADGHLALQRLSVEADPSIRVAVAKAIGELGQVSLAPALIAMLEDRPVPMIRRAALEALTSIAGGDMATDIRSDGTGSEDQEVEAWKRWWRSEQPASISRQSGDQRSSAR